MKSLFTLSTLAVLLAAGASAESIPQRKANQQHRIAQGVASGQLTPRETARLERQEGDLNRQLKVERAFNGGKLTPGERAQAQRELNTESRRIYRAKHNAAHR